MSKSLYKILLFFHKEHKPYFSQILILNLGIGIATQEEFLNHLFTCRADAMQANIKNQIVGKVSMQQALDYNLVDKCIWFREKLSKLRISFYEDTLTLVLSRDNAMMETLNQFSTVDALNLHKDIKIFFIDEEARDAGGVIREWISVISEELLKPEEKNFELVQNEDDVFYTIHPESTFDSLHFAGQIFGKAIFEGVSIDCKLSRLLLHKMLGIEADLEEFKKYDPMLYSSLNYMNNDDVNVEDLCMNFTIMDSGKTIELKPNGSEIALTNENKAEYIRLTIDHYTSMRAPDQTYAFISAFKSVIPHEYMEVFTIDQLEQVFFGQLEISTEDWKNNTFYKGKYMGSQHQVVDWFWEIVAGLDNDQKRKFLQFCTGSKSLPIEGFKGLKGQKKQPCKFSIESVSLRKSQFPRAHTCFNSLELPLYNTKQELQNGIDFVLSQTEFHFGLE